MHKHMVCKTSNVVRALLFLIVVKLDTQDPEYFTSKLLKSLILLRCTYT